MPEPVQRRQKDGRGFLAAGCLSHGWRGLTMDPHGKLVSIWRRENEVYIAQEGSPEKKIETGKDAAIATGPAACMQSGTAPAQFTPV